MINLAKDNLFASAPEACSKSPVKFGNKVGINPARVLFGFQSESITGAVAPGGKEYVVPETTIVLPGEIVTPSITKPDT